MIQSIFQNVKNSQEHVSGIFHTKLYNFKRTGRIKLFETKLLVIYLGVVLKSNLTIL